MEQQFGEQEVCFRTLDLYTSAVLEASLNPAVTPKAEYRDAMAKMSEVRSSTSYNKPLILITSNPQSKQAEGIRLMSQLCSIHCLNLTSYQ